MKKFLLVLVAVVCSACNQNDSHAQHDPLESSASQSSDQLLARAFENRQSKLQVEGWGTVSKALSDDREGSQHQRFIVKLDSGQRLLVAHNIDLAPRVDGLAAGGRVEFKGEYEWNAKGGVVHWTHRDPSGRHAAGWIKYGGRVYQ